jgi:hypothetical protein
MFHIIHTPTVDQMEAIYTTFSHQQRPIFSHLAFVVCHTCLQRLILDTACASTNMTPTKIEQLEKKTGLIWWSSKLRGGVGGIFVRVIGETTITLSICSILSANQITTQDNFLHQWSSIGNLSRPSESDECPPAYKC